MKPDTISVRVVQETELDADSADLTVVIEGSSVFSGSQAFKKAKELQELLEVLQEAGIEENQVKLRNVHINSQSFALIKSSSARYTVLIKKVSLERLPPVLSAVAAHKGAELSHLLWKYGELKTTRRRLRREALSEAMEQARGDAELLGVEVLGIYQLSEAADNKEHRPEYIGGNSGDFLAMRSRASKEDIGLHLGNSTTVTVDLRAEFRVGSMTNPSQPNPPALPDE